MAGRKGAKQLNKQEFEKPKNVLSLGVSWKEVSRLTGRSNSTIARISSSRDWTDYNFKLAELKNKRRKALEVKEVPQAETPLTTDIREDLLKVLNNIEAEIKNINENHSELKEHIVWIENHLPVDSKVKSWFRS